MQTQRDFVSFQCWHSDRIGQVINKEAASVGKATFLATHTPMNKLLYEKEPYAITDTSEAGLLRELQHYNSEDRHAFIVVQGIPGTGKSHLIRWLADRYEAEEGHRGSVLFITRAQCSLSGTIEQIVKSGVFDDSVMSEQREKLKGATNALSDKALAQTILYQLHLATTEVQQPAMAKWMAKADRLGKFLLDFTVRTELLKPNGPIDRLVRFLKQGPNTGLSKDEMPKFEAYDFEFKAATLQNIGKGYEEAENFATRLQGEDAIEKREELARYLNQLIQYAVGHATSLTSDDLKQLFNDLRRYLRKQNRHLALFIEDVTAFTGIDLGLIDVLATQHTGEANQEFCRLISVIGITDNYYFDHFPDNLKDRVTHRISLNARGEVRSDAEILTDEHTTAAMSARYLNAMRVHQEDLDTWQANGAKPEHLPNACDACRFKQTCHATFGFEEVNVGQDMPLHIGLYPFNKRAIWNLYQHIDTSYTKRTPRSLLYNVLSYILQSYGQRLTYGAFPPLVSELGSSFTTFSLKKPLQRGLINDQGKQDAKRIEALILLWGDGTVNAEKVGEQHTVGGLSAQVFKAFMLPVIIGEVSQTVTIPIITKNYTSIGDATGNTPTTNPYSASNRANITANSLPISSPEGPASMLVTQEQTAQRNKYTDDISSWLNGNKLVYYRDYSELLVPFIRSFIDWELHEVNSPLVDELLSGRRFSIEDQVGKTNSAYYFTFSRSPELAAVLQAMIELKGSNSALLPASILSGHLTNISLWLHQQEEAIVNFVRQPNHETKEGLSLTKMLLLNVLLLTCLRGKLSSPYESPQQLFLQLVSVSTTTKESSWQESVAISQAFHSQEWYGLMKRLKPASVERQYKTLLSVLNCAQGGSSGVRFVDAATALTLLAEFAQSDWTLPSSGAVGSSSVQYWDETTTMYETLSTYFIQALDADRAYVQNLLQRFDNLIGVSSSKEVFEAINNFVKAMINSKRGTDFERKTSFNATGLDDTLSQLRAIVRKQRTAQLALRLSSAEELLASANGYLKYLEAFMKEVTKQQRATQIQITDLKGRIGTTKLDEKTQIEVIYQEIEQLLLHTKGEL